MVIPKEVEPAIELWSKDGRFVPLCVSSFYAHDDPNRWVFRESLDQGERPQEIAAWDVWLKEDQQALLEAILGKLIVVLSSFGSIDLQIQNETVSMLHREKQEVRRFRSQKTMLRNLLLAVNRVLDLNWIPRFQSVTGKWHYSVEEAMQDEPSTQELLHKKSILETNIKARGMLKNDPFGFSDSTGVPMEVLMERLNKDNEVDRKEITDIDNKLSKVFTPGLFRGELRENVEAPNFPIPTKDETWVMDRWVEFWEKDAGVIPVGAEFQHERIGPGGEMLDTFWTYYGKRIVFDARNPWTRVELDKLYSAQLGAAVNRLIRIEGFTLKILGNRVVGIFQNEQSRISNSCTGDYTALLGNLAILFEWVLPQLPERITNSENGTLKLDLGFSLLA